MFCALLLGRVFGDLLLLLRLPGSCAVMSVAVRSQEIFCCVAEEFPRAIGVSVMEMLVVAAGLPNVKKCLVGGGSGGVGGPESWSAVCGWLRSLWELVDDQVVVAWSRSLLLALGVCAWSEECVVDAPLAVFPGGCPVVEVGVAVRGDAVGQDMRDSSLAGYGVQVADEHEVLTGAA